MPRRSLWARVLGLASIILAGLAAFVALWDPLDIDDRAHVQRITSHAVKGVRANLAAGMQSRLLAQVLLAKRWAARGPLSRQDWEVNSRLFLDQHPSYVVVQWVDPTYHVWWAVARDGQHDERELDFITDQQLRPVLQAALNRRSGDAVISPAFQLPDGRAAARVVVPIFRGDVFAGFLIAVFDIKAALDSMLADHTELGYSVSVLEGTAEIYGTPGTSRAYQDAWAQNADLQFPGIAWCIRLWPNPELLAEMRSPLLELAVVLGGCLGSY